MIAGMKTPTVSLVVGGGHSIGIPLAVSAKRSMIVPSATMTLHPVRTNGPVLGVPQTAIYFEKIQNRIDRFLLRHSHITKETLKKLLYNTRELATDIGTTLSGKEAVSCGLIDRVGTLHKALQQLDQLIETSQNSG
jgi:ATP-dependent protease ClpP protease subunit